MEQPLPFLLPKARFDDLIGLLGQDGFEVVGPCSSSLVL
jgi:hypothetical protein